MFEGGRRRKELRECEHRRRVLHESANAVAPDSGELTMNDNKHIHGIQSQWVALPSLIWHRCGLQLSKQALECIESCKMTAWGELRFCEGMR